MSKSYLWLPLAAATMMMAGTVHSASVDPVLIEGPISGGAAAECTAVGYEGFCSFKPHMGYDAAGNLIEWPVSGSFNVECTIDDVTTINTIVVSNPTDKSFDWSSYFGLGVVLVKGGPDLNAFYYSGAWSDTGLYAPENKDISHVTFCWNPDEYGPPPGSEWCSPGYWRQPQHAGAWTATGYSYESVYSGPTAYSATKRACMGLPAVGPTFIQVLQNPQCYGGEAFNAIGDTLSGAHPDVDFDGMRTENSCPLGRYPTE